MRLCRIDSRYSQQALAEGIGLSRDQLKRIEKKQVAPRFWPAWKFCQLLDINPLWLAFGPVFDERRWIDIAVGDIPPGALFTAVMRNPQFRNRFFGKLSGKPRERVKLPKRARVNFDDQIEYLARVWRTQVRPTEEQDFFFYLASAAGQYLGRKEVDRLAVKRYLGDVIAIPLSWAGLKRRLQVATQKPGAKAALARRFDVSTAAVSQWLSSKSHIAPKAETTLQLLEWVAAEEAKQKKGAGSAETRPALKTRKSKSTKYEKAKSDQRKE
jgi:transcriptional regulator with XRE-family HTH domain